MINANIVMVEEAGEMRFPDADGPWTIRCYVRTPEKLVDPPRFGFVLQAGSDRFSSNFESDVHPDGPNTEDVNKAYVQLHLDLHRQGIDPELIDIVRMHDMAKMAWKACVLSWVSIFARRYSKGVTAAEVAAVWGLEEVRHVMTT